MFPLMSHPGGGSAQPWGQPGSAGSAGIWTGGTVTGGGAGAFSTRDNGGGRGGAGGAPGARGRGAGREPGRCRWSAGATRQGDEEAGGEQDGQDDRGGGSPKSRSLRPAIDLVRDTVDSHRPAPLEAQTRGSGELLRRAYSHRLLGCRLTAQLLSCRF